MDVRVVRNVEVVVDDAGMPTREREFTLESPSRTALAIVDITIEACASGVMGPAQDDAGCESGMRSMACLGVGSEATKVVAHAERRNAREAARNELKTVRQVNVR